MEDDNEINSIYKNKSICEKMKLELFFLIMLLIIATIGFIFIDNIFLKIAILSYGLYIIHEIFYIKKEYEIAKEIKEYGKVFEGEAVRFIAYRRRTSVRTYNKLIVRFLEDNQYKYVVVPKFPFVLEIINNKNMFFNQKNHSFDENLESISLNIEQYNKYNCISFNEKEKWKKYKYCNKAEKNFEGNIFCKVYKNDDIYLVDEFKNEEITYNENIHKIVNKIMLVFFAISIGLLVYYVKNMV